MENMDKGLTQREYRLCTKMGADSLAKNYLPNLSAQAQQFWISMKKGFIGRT